VFRFDQDKAKSVFDSIIYEKESVCISILLTEKCNFTCEHCFYGCGPHKSPKYISHRHLRYIEDMTAKLNCEYGIASTVNLIGGEPTVNLKQFDRVCEWADELNDQGVNIEMTTNGWWLEKPSTTYRFLKSIQRFDYSLSTDTISIRISNDRFHDRWHKLDTPYRYILDSLVSCNEHPYGNMFEDEYHYFDMSKLNNVIFVDQDRDESQVVPAGVRGTFGYDDRGSDRRCSFGSSISFKPNGKMYDGCGCGSDMPFGTVYDDPVVLMCLESYFINNVIRKDNVSCIDCRDTARAFRKSSVFNKLKTYFKDKVENYLIEKEESELCEIIA
jgi:sulfatase maturation enzyme AslB (radical SAM superfamily)